MYTTLSEIKRHSPCQDGWANLLRGLGKTKADDEPLPLIDILKINGIQDAIWSLRTQSPQVNSYFIAKIAEYVLPIFERVRPNDSRVRDAIAAHYDFAYGMVDDTYLSEAKDVAREAATEAEYSSAGAVAWGAACAVAWAAASAVACDAALEAAGAAAYAASDAARSEAESAAWDEARAEAYAYFEEVFVKMCEGNHVHNTK